MKYPAGFLWCIEPIRAYLKASSLLHVGHREICELRVPRLQTPLFNSNNNNNTHRPYFHSQAFNLMGCVGGVSVTLQSKDGVDRGIC